MAVEPLTLDAIVRIDNGRVREAFELALRRLQTDCQDRPGLNEPRHLTLKCTLTPVPDEDGNLDSCHVQFRVTDQLPTRRSKVYNARAAPDGQLLFNELSPDDVRQATLDMETGPRRAVGATGTDGLRPGETLDILTGEVR